MLYGCTIRDRKSTKELLDSLKLPSVNQLAIEIKLTEVWKSIHDKDYPIQMKRNIVDGGENNRTLRPSTIRELTDNAKTKIGEESFCISAAKIWNSAPEKVKESKTIREAKRNIKEFCKNMPV